MTPYYYLYNGRAGDSDLLLVYVDKNGKYSRLFNRTLPLYDLRLKLAKRRLKKSAKRSE